MIVAVTKLKRIPEKCTKCVFSQVDYWSYYPRVNIGRQCTLTHRALPMDKSPKGNMQYIKPYWCPLKEVSQDSFDK